MLGKSKLVYLCDIWRMKIIKKIEVYQSDQNIEMIRVDFEKQTLFAIDRQNFVYQGNIVKFSQEVHHDYSKFGSQNDL